MNHSFDVLLVGGGVVGLTAALAMAKRDYSVALIESGCLKGDLRQEDLRVFAINPASQSLLEELDVWQLLQSKGIAAYSKMHVWDAANGARIDFDSRYIAAQSLGFIVGERVLKHALLQEIAAQSKIHLFPECLVDDLQCEPQVVKLFSQNQVWEGQLLMVADGALSPTRERLKVELTHWSYNQHALIANIRTEHPHEQTAFQMFTQEGTLALLPLAQPYECSIVWSTTASAAEQLMNLPNEAFNEKITTSFQKKLGAIQVASSRRTFPLHMRHVKQYVGPRWLLLGDAAHTIHPLAGLGLNLGLADVGTWVKILDKKNSKGVSCKQLGAYQRERKHVVWQTILLMEAFKRLFTQGLEPIVSIRGLGLRACNKRISLKRFFIEYAAGL